MLLLLCVSAVCDSLSYLNITCNDNNHAFLLFYYFQLEITILSTVTFCSKSLNTNNEHNYVFSPLVTTILNPAPAQSELPEEMFRLTDILCLNETEVRPRWSAQCIAKLHIAIIIRWMRFIQIKYSSRNETEKSFDDECNYASCTPYYYHTFHHTLHLMKIHIFGAGRDSQWQARKLCSTGSWRVRHVHRRAWRGNRDRDAGLGRRCDWSTRITGYAACAMQEGQGRRQHGKFIFKEYLKSICKCNKWLRHVLIKDVVGWQGYLTNMESQRDILTMLN